MNSKIKKKRELVEFKIQFECLSWFSYLCGYLSHQDKSCGRNPCVGNMP